MTASTLREAAGADPADLNQSSGPRRQDHLLARLALFSGWAQSPAPLSTVHETAVTPVDSFGGAGAGDAA